MLLNSLLLLLFPAVFPPVNLTTVIVTTTVSSDDLLVRVELPTVEVTSCKRFVIPIANDNETFESHDVLSKFINNWFRSVDPSNVCVIHVVLIDSGGFKTHYLAGQQCKHEAEMLRLTHVRIERYPGK